MVSSKKVQLGDLKESRISQGGMKSYYITWIELGEASSSAVFMQIELRVNLFFIRDVFAA